MKPHDILDEAARDLAASYALGLLSAGEEREAERHLATCSACREEVDSLCETAAALALSAPAAAVPGDLKARLMAATAGPRGLAVAPPAAQSWKTWRDDAGIGNVLLLDAATKDWEPTGVVGVEARKLFVDTMGDRVTMLVRMAPGTSYPAHVHAGPEECYVIAGDLDVGGVLMTAGSYQRMAAGIAHPVQSTREGCVLLIQSSLSDELLG